MGSFDTTKTYAPQEQTFFDDGREVELLHFVYSHPQINKIRGSPKDVLAAIDEFGRTKKYLMNVGEDKGRIVTDLIAEVKPQTMVCLLLPKKNLYETVLISSPGRTRRLRRLFLYPLR
jgi:catechol O-methyltransferase